MPKQILPVNDVIQKYRQGQSLHQLAESYKTYPNKILRLLRKHGEDIRDKGQALSTAYKSGRKKHPTEGRERTEEERLKISENLEEFYDKLTPEEYNKIRQRGQKNWKRLSKETREEMLKKSAESNRKAAKDGSAVEIYVKEMLEEAGFYVEHHKKDLLSTNLEVDLFLPRNNVVIEIDGPSHYRPIWGDEALERQRKYDTMKNGIIVGVGLVILRVKYDRSKLSLGVKNRLKKTILTELTKIKDKFPDKNNRIINVEV